jgi:hypothetical protein
MSRCATWMMIDRDMIDLDTMLDDDRSRIRRHMYTSKN